MAKKRLDVLLVERGLAESRAKAQALIMAGEVTVANAGMLKPGMLLDETAEISVRQPPPYVSRGGLKLAYALEEFGIEVAGKVAADIGASTGGFTDCLLQHGASRVYAIDVGTGQLDYRLRRDPRVVVMEGVNARYPVPLPQMVDIVTIDVSFISLEKVIPAVLALLKEDGNLVVLLKPQFEAHREEVGKGGIVRQPQVHARVLGRFIKWAIENGLRIGGLVESPIAGAEGNREFLLLLKRTD